MIEGLGGYFARGKDILSRSWPEDAKKSCFHTERASPAHRRASGIGKTTLTKNIAFALPPKAVKGCPYHCNPTAPVCPTCRMKVESGQKLRPKKSAGKKVQHSGFTRPDRRRPAGRHRPSMAFIRSPDYRSFTQETATWQPGVVFFDEINRARETAERVA